MVKCRVGNDPNYYHTNTGNPSGEPVLLVKDRISRKTLTVYLFEETCSGRADSNRIPGFTANLKFFQSRGFSGQKPVKRTLVQVKLVTASATDFLQYEFTFRGSVGV